MAEVISGFIIFLGLINLADEVKNLNELMNNRINYFEAGYQAGRRDKNRGADNG